ncbi:rna binding protein [Ophiostoma piceae UAMH 11346]|uniref:Rna binding protein n=1 Tax=Ophiostoma piceae (strain UAMH 11346) TaxID=1262450 RepID=S3C8D9_OPHP1|nr:rna binding protein [Ophiostoma piceae UAMH 11346]
MATEGSVPPSADVAPATADSADKKRKTANADVAELEVDISLPEPPSKRAKRALKKGKVLPAKPRPALDGDENDDEAAAAGVPGSSSSKGKGGKKEKEERSQFGIWIGNLPFTVTRLQLFKWFVDNSGGAIAESDITRINLPLGKRAASHVNTLRPHNVHADSDGKALPPNKGFAYVDFLTLEAQIAASALSETEIDGRRVLIKDSKSFEGRPASTPQTGDDAAAAAKAPRNKAGEANEDENAAPQGTTSTKVFVGNLGFETSEEDIRRHFAPCGPIAWVKVATFPDNTEKCRGYGWVQFGGKTDEGVNITPEAASEAAVNAVRGYVRLQEKIDTEEDFVAEAEGAADDAEAKESKEAKKTRTRKWWVNQFKGRPLKVQFAEDDVSRYKKRFGKGRPRDGDEQTGSRPPNREERRGKPFKQREIGIAALTGGIVESTGTKTVFE